MAQQEKTGKPLKAGMVVSVLIVLGSLGGALYLGTPEAYTQGAYGVAVGLGGYFLTRFLAWWQYG